MVFGGRTVAWELMAVNVCTRISFFLVANEWYGRRPRLVEADFEARIDAERWVEVVARVCVS